LTSHSTLESQSVCFSFNSACVSSSSSNFVTSTYRQIFGASS
jgi:hypothetical protein